DVTAMRVVGVARQTDTAQLRAISPGEDRNPVEAFLTVPHSAVARRFDVGDRELIVGAFKLLQAGNVRPFAVEPFEKAGHARANAVDVERCELHPRRLAASAQPGKRA